MKTTKQIKQNRQSAWLAVCYASKRLQLSEETIENAFVIIIRFLVFSKGILVRTVHTAEATLLAFAVATRILVVKNIYRAFTQATLLYGFHFKVRARERLTSLQHSLYKIGLSREHENSTLDKFSPHIYKATFAKMKSLGQGLRAFAREKITPHARYAQKSPVADYPHNFFNPSHSLIV